MKPNWYLIVEDQATKAVNYKEFEKDYQLQNTGFDFEFVLAYTPRIAYQLLISPNRPAGLAGVIADFSLGATTPHHANERAVVAATADPLGIGYEIWTGLGILDWVHQNEPEVPLWALTDVTAAHAPLFMGGSALWLGASPLSVGRFTQKGPLRDQLLAELRDPARAKDINPIWHKVEEAALAFRTLLNRRYNGIESFDCMRAFISMQWSVASRGFEQPFVRELQAITGRDEVRIFTQTFARDMTLWQWSLEDMYEPFPINRKAERWPVFDREQRALKAWADFNPFTDFLARNSECEEFFLAPDVDVCFRRWRARPDSEDAPA